MSLSDRESRPGLPTHQGLELLVRNPDARVLVVSQRLLHRTISRATIYEFEDLVCALDGADLVAPTRRLRRRGERLRARVRMLFGLGAAPERRRGRPLLERRYDLLLVCCEDLSDLLALGPLDRWLQLADRTVCYVEELWRVHVPQRAVEVSLLGAFDRVWLSCAGAVAAVAERTGKPCDYLAPAVDALAFAPPVDGRAPPRVIDVYAMGRRPQAVHEVLHELCAERDWFYLYDTFTGNRAIDPADHRRLLASLVQRTRYFLAYRAKFDEPALTGEQEEVGSRHFEGAAGGAVLVGHPLQVPTFEQAFGYPDAVVPVGDDPAAIRDVLAGLEADPDRVAAIRAANIRNCLQRHDWVHRWQQVLAALDLPPRPPVEDRLAALAARRQTV